MNRKDKLKGTYIICANCGIAGATLVKPDKDIDAYFCANVLACKARRIAGELTPYKQICSHANCSKGAAYKCSCGMWLCDQHARSYRFHHH